MFWLVIEVIIASIAVSLIARALKLIPRYDRLVHRILLQVLNGGVLTIVLTFLFVYGVRPGWVEMGSMVFLSLIASIVVTNLVAHKRGSNPL
jgi:membrane-bound metal-dependent hydrolase YbcI (DUF457 family)